MEGLLISKQTPCRPKHTEKSFFAVETETGNSRKLSPYSSLIL